MMARLLVLVCAGWLFSAAAHAKEPAPSYARVAVESAALRSGPGADFRIIQIAHRDDVLRVRGRAPIGHWLELELSDGSTAYLQGDAAWLFDATTSERPPHERFRIFAPPPLVTAHGELAITFGVLGESGFLGLRPALMLGPSFALEANLGASVGAGGRLFLVGLGGLVNLFPSWPITPFVVAGGGGARSLPNSDAFIFEAGTRSLLYGGGGLRFGFRRRLIVRIEGRGYALFDADRLVARQEISGGLSAFF